MKRWSGLLLGLCMLAAQAQTANKPLHARIEGAVLHPGTYALPAKSRLADAVLAALPDHRTYPLGAALLREDAKLVQLRLKAGLLYDLDTLAKSPEAKPELQQFAMSQHAWLDALPVTGRVPALLEARALEITATANTPLHDGDVFVYPQRPDSVHIVGAVAHACEVPQIGLRDARDYLRSCPRNAFADADWLYAIQPDGHVEKLGIALWDRSAPYPLAPGAMLYVPLAEKHIAPIDADFNLQMAQFLATQHLPAAAAEHTP